MRRREGRNGKGKKGGIGERMREGEGQMRKGVREMMQGIEGGIIEGRDKEEGERKE